MICWDVYMHGWNRKNDLTAPSEMRRQFLHTFTPPSASIEGVILLLKICDTRSLICHPVEEPHPVNSVSEVRSGLNFKN